MKKGVVLGAFVGALVLLIFSAWLLNAQFVNFQTRITSLVTVVNNLQGQNTALNRQISELESQIISLESQNSDLVNQTKSLENQNEVLMNHAGNLTAQLALERPIQVEIVSLVRASSGGSFGGLLWAYDFSLTIRNDDVVTVSGIVLTLNVYFGDKLVGNIPYTNRCLEIDLLNAGEERVISFEYVVSLEFVGKPLTYVTTLKSGEVILDQLTET